MQNKHTVMKSYTPMPTISNTVDALFTNDKFSYSISRRNTSRIIKRNSSPSIEDSLYSRQLEVQSKISQRRREQQREESEECTGRPRISRNSQHLAQKRFKSIKGDLLKHLVDQCPMAREIARYRSFPTNLVAHSPKATCNSEPPEAFHCHVQVKGGRMTSSPLELGALTTNGSVSNRSSPIPFSMREVLRDQQKFSAQDGLFSAEQVKSATLFNMKSDQYYKPIPNILDLSHTDREKVLKELKDAKIKFYLDLREQEKMRNCTFSPMLGEKQLQRRCARKKRQDQQQPATYLEIHNKNKELRKKKKGNQRRKKGTNGKRSSIDLDFMHFIQHQQQIDSEFLQMFVKFTRGFCQINPYMILGVSKDANPDQIKQAYFKLAKKYHPDSQGGDAEKFKQIQDAYQKLKTGAYTETVDQEDAFYTAKAYYEQEYRRQYY